MEPEHKKSAQHPPWGTLEELLLACAVNRHGTDSWDSIVVEVQNRTSSLPALTSQNCIDKFNDLKRRFMSLNDTASLIDELRRLRVEELRREVQRHDVSIVSLEMKVKRLEEERQRSLKEEIDLLPEKKPSPEKLADKPTAGEESGDDRSFNESNSTTQQKAETTTGLTQNDAVDEEADIKPEPETKNEKVRTGSETKEGRDWSHNGKLEDDDENNVDNKKIVGGEKKKNEMTTKPNRAGGESNELGESAVESKREEKKQNSDVQSSASLSLKKKKRRRRGGVVGSSSCEEPEGGDEVSPATKRMSAVKSEPLNNLLGIIRSHRLGSTFERRLRSQESERYKSLIRQHVDLRMVQSRLDKGIYSSCIHKFFRDLLLLFNNAILFFRRNSPENLAAKELRAVVRKEMAQRLTKPKPQPATAKAEPRTQPLPFSKPSKASTMVVCGKRSSTKAISGNSSKKGEKKDKKVEEKTKADEEKIESSFEDKGIRKKRTKERSVSGLRNNPITNKNGEIKHQYGGNELSSHDGLDAKMDKKESTARKKQGAANFLKRMKQNSLSELTENDDDDDEESSDNESKDSKRKEEKKKKAGQSKAEGGGLTVRVTRSSRGRGGRGESGRGKKTIGRPPKKQAEVGGGAGKRGRDSGDSEVAGGGGRARKKARR